MSIWKLEKKTFPSLHVALCWLPFSADHSKQLKTLKSRVLRKCVICISDTYWVPWTPPRYKAAPIEPSKHLLGRRWKIWLLTSWGQCIEPSSGTPSPSSFLWNQNIHHYLETCSLLTPQLQHHRKLVTTRFLKTVLTLPIFFFFFLTVLPSCLTYGSEYMIFCALHFVASNCSSKFIPSTSVGWTHKNLLRIEW